MRWFFCGLAVGLFFLCGPRFSFGQETEAQASDGAGAVPDIPEADLGFRFSGLFLQDVLASEDPVFELDATYARVSFGAQLDWGILTGIADVSLGLENGAPFLEPEELSLNVAGDFGSLKAGWFDYKTGANNFFRLLDVFHAEGDLGMLETGGLSDSYPEFLFQARLSHEDVSLVLSWAPFEAPWDLPSPESPWFPKRSIQRSWYVPVLGTTYYLKDLAVEGPDWEAFSWASVPNVAAEIVWQGSFADWRFLFFYGTFRNAAFPAEIALNVTPSNTYNITLKPERSAGPLVASSLIIPMQDFTLGAEIRYSGNRLVTTSDLYGAGSSLSTRTFPIQLLEVAGGLTWRLSGLPLDLSTETRWTFYPEAVDIASYAFLAQSSMLAARLRLFDDRLVIDSLVLISWQDQSGVFLGGLSFFWEEDKSVWIKVPVLWGEASSEWGQYKERSFFQAGLAWGMAF